MVSTTFSVCVVGSLNMDTVEFVDSRTQGNATITRPEEVFCGGIGANHAMAIHRMTSKARGHDTNLPFDVSVSMIGKIGGDDNGKELHGKLRRSHIDIQAVTTSKKQPTGTAKIMVRNDGQSVARRNPGANSELLPADIERAWKTSDFDLVVVSIEIPHETASKAVALAREHKVPVILNLAPEPKPSVLADNELFNVDHLIMNHRDADSILDLPSIEEKDRRKKFFIQRRYSEAADRFHKMGASCVVITLGEMGAFASYVVPESEQGAGCQTTWFVGAQVPVDPKGGPQKVTDSIGASDAFVGAYTAEILRRLHDERAISQGQAISAALEMGTKAGGYSVGVVGGMEGCPWRDQIVGQRAFMAVKPFPR
jgi:ribokinase